MKRNKPEDEGWKVAMEMKDSPKMIMYAKHVEWFSTKVIWTKGIWDKISYDTLKKELLN